MNHVVRRISEPCCLRLVVLVWFLSTFLVCAQMPTRLNTTLVGSNKPPQAASGFGDVWGDGNLACLGVWTAYNTFGVGIYNIANPASPQLLSVYNYGSGVGNRFEQGVIRSNILYLGSWGGGSAGSGGSGLHILSLTNPAVPVLLSRITANAVGTVVNGFDNVHTLFLERNFLYEAAHNVGLLSVKVFDVSNPAQPVYVRDIVTTNTTKVHQMTVGTNQHGRVVLYTSGWGGNDNGAPGSPGQTDIWDVTQIGSQPAQWLGRIYAGYNSHSSWPTPDGNTLIVCREMPGGDVKLYDISNPTTLTSNTPPLCTITPGNMGLETDIPHNPVVVGNHLFLSWYQNGLQIFDITDRTQPVRVGAYDTYPASATSSYQGNWGVYPQLGFDKILLSDIQSGFCILDASAVLTPTNNYPPMILTQPTSLTVTQGANVIFSAVVTGSSLNYQWRFNGATLANGTDSSLYLSNAQPAQAGSYTLVVSNSTAALTSSVVALSVGNEQSLQTAFIDPFDSASSSTNWDFFEGSANGIPDYTVDWSFDYSAYFSAFNGTTIPPAPNTTNGTTRGLRLMVNNAPGTGAQAGLSLYPKSKFFSGAYKLRFDLWINYPGGPAGAGSTGSTEHFTCGLNHAGTRINWDSSTANPSDGIWFAMDGDGGTSSDYRAYLGNALGSPALLSFANSGFSASGGSSRDSADARWLSIFPAPIYESPGAPGKKWTQVELSQDTNNLVTWRMNGSLIAQRLNTSTFTNGTIMIGYMDLFTSIANPAVDAFVIFDNVRVEVPAPTSVPTIATQPENISVYPGQGATFTVAATGSGTLGYQWQFNGANIPGATSNSFTRGIVQPEKAGVYSVIVANEIGATVSSNAALLLLDSPYVSAVQAAPGSHSALIAWTTTVPGDSLVQFDVASFVIPNAFSAAAAAQGSFSLSSHIDPILTTNHVILLTGLQPGTRYSYQTLSSAETNTYVSGVYQFTTAGSLILDNIDATFTGNWTEAGLSADKYATNYHYASAVTGPATATATWRPNIITPGKCDVYIWYPEGGNRANNAPYSISAQEGTFVVPVNQQSGGGGWQLLAAAVDFAKGTNGFVRLSNNANPSVVIADAVRFDYVQAQDFPASPTVPTWWEAFYFNGSPDPTLDPDGDAYTTAQEYVMGTCPTNAASHLELSSVTGSNQSASVTFKPLLGNRRYDLLLRTNLNVAVWQKATAAPPTATADGGGVFSLGTTNDAQNYYRLRIQMSINGASSGFRALPGVFPAFTSEAACGPFRVYLK